MPSTAEPIIAQVQQQFQELVAYVTGPETRTSTAYQVELTLFRRLLALGAALLRLFFVTRAGERPTEPVTGPNGTLLAYHDRRRTTYYSVFGKLAFSRHAFTGPTSRWSARWMPLSACPNAATPSCYGSG